MKVTVEFAETRSPHFHNVVRLCKKFSSYKLMEDDGLRVHSVTFEDKDLVSFEAIERMIWAWRNAAYFIDGQLVTREKAFNAMARQLQEKARGTDVSKLQSDALYLSAFNHLVQRNCPRCAVSLKTSFEMTITYSVYDQWRIKCQCHRCEADLTDLAQTANALGPPGALSVSEFLSRLMNDTKDNRWDTGK